MLWFVVFARTDPRIAKRISRPPAVPFLRILALHPRPVLGVAERSSNSHEITSFAAPHLITLVESYRSKTALAWAWGIVFARSLPTVTPLDATLMGLPVSVANKRLTNWLTPLDATLTKSRGYPRRSSISAFRFFDVRTCFRSLPSRRHWCYHSGRNLKLITHD